MPRTCTICAHPHVAEIDRALLSGEPLRNIAKRFAISVSALHRHRHAHLPALLVETKQAEDAARAIDIVEQLRAINEVCRRILDEAHNPRLALQAVDRIARQIELQAKLLGELQQRQVTMNVLIASPEWIRTRQAIVRALQPFPEAAQAVAEELRRLEHE